MLTRKTILTMTTAAALCAAPMLALGQANTGGSSQMQGTTQTTPQQGALGGTPAARGAATTGSDTGMAPGTGGTPMTGQGAQGRTTNPSGAATGQPLGTSGGQAAAPGAPGATTQGTPGPSQGQLDRIRQNEGNTTGQDARGGVTAQGGGATGTGRDGTPGNPPSTATQRALDGATGNRTDADGTGNNPPGTAVGRALDRATDGATPTQTAPGQTGTALGRQTGTTGAATGAAATGAGVAGAMAVDSARLRDGRRASQVIGSTIYNENNETIGEVDDLIVPSGSGQPVAIISVGGFLGIGARLVAVPYERLQHNADRNRWMLQGATRDSLQSLPAYSHDNNGRR